MIVEKVKQEGDGVAGPRGGAVRRAAGVRGARQRRPRAAAAADADEPHHADAGSNDEADEAHANDLADAGKVGAKKRAKLEAKAERKAQREQGTIIDNIFICNKLIQIEEISEILRDSPLNHPVFPNNLALQNQLLSRSLFYFY